MNLLIVNYFFVSDFHWRTLGCGQRFLTVAQRKSMLILEFFYPIRRPPIVKVEFVFVFARDRDRVQVLRASLDGFASDGDEDLRFFPAHAFDPRWRKEHFLARPPIL